MYFSLSLTSFIEGGTSKQHFIDEAAKTPVIHSSIVSLTENNLRRKVKGGATERIGLVCDTFGCNNKERVWFVEGICEKDWIVNLMQISISNPYRIPNQ